MKQILVILAAMMISATTFGQLVAGNDTIICNSATVNLTATANTSGVLFNGLTSVALTDDVHSGVVNIGFPFTFYGSSYTQCVIASNNYITFDLSQASAYSPWSINAAIPDPSLPVNAIMCPYQDINPGAGGVVEYGTVGTAPNRIFVVRYFQVPMFSCTSLQFCSAIFIYEGSNRIETHIENKPLCSTWNGGVAIHGLHNSTGTLADVVPGRNYPTQWTTALEGMEFVPNGGSAYTINTVPFEAVVSNNNIEWYDGGTLVGTGVSLPVTPSVTTDYEARLTFCDGTIWRDTMTVAIGAQLSFNNTEQPTACAFASGVGEVNPSGGAAGYGYSWSPGGYTDSLVTGLGVGLYTITVTDSATGCATTTTINIVENNTVDVSIASFSDADCNGASTGTATAAGANGAGSYTYVWNDPGAQTGGTASGLAVGTWQVIVTDADGCQDSTTVTIGQPSLISTIVSGVVDVSCNGGSDGAANVFATGGNPGYSYSWNDPSNQTVSSASGLPAGTWVVTITDSTGCMQTDTVTISEPTAVAATILYTVDVSCNGGADGSGEVAGTGGTAPYSYDWVGLGVSSPDAYNLPAGTYDVTIIDAQGCVFTQQVTITEPAAGTASSTVTEATCGLSDGTAFASPNGGASPYTYSWDAGAGNQTTQTATGLSAGTYTCTITDANGCSFQTTATLTDTIDIAASFLANPAQGVAPLDVSFNNTTTGNPASYSWDFGNGDFSTDANPATIYTAPGTYLVTLIVTNAGGCTDMYQVTVIVNRESSLSAPNVFSPNGDGYNDVFMVQHEAITNFECTIFNRWGNEVYRFNAVDGNWNGGDEAEGSYYYTIVAKGDDGRDYDMSGHVTLVR